MFGTETDEPDPLAKRRRDRRLLGGLVAAAMLAFFTLDYVGQPLIAVGAYWLFVLGAAVLVYTSDEIMDERDVALERRTSHRAMHLIGAGLVVLGPGLGGLAAANVYDAPPVLDGVLLGWVVLFAVWGLSYLWERTVA